MEVTLLGSGEAVGVPAPLCDCQYCTETQRRRRPGLLIETADVTVVLDISPDIKEQLHVTRTASVDAFFVTHHHFDHIGGIHELNHAAMGFDTHVGIDGGPLPAETFSEDEKPVDPEFQIYLTETALGHVENANPHLVDAFDLRTFDHGNAIQIGDISVVPFPVRHADTQFDTCGFAVYHDEKKVVYAPDMWEFIDDTEYKQGDLLFAEGAALFRAFGHGEESDLRAALDTADATRTILINLNEHLQRMTTQEMANAIDQERFELGEDFDTHRL